MMQFFVIGPVNWSCKSDYEAKMYYLLYYILKKEISYYKTFLLFIIQHRFGLRVGRKTLRN